MSERAGVEVFVARQPIFDRSARVFGYELLHRSGLQNHYTSANGSAASLSVIDSTFSVLGMDVTSCGRRPFVNFTRQLLVGDFAFLLPTHVVVEVLENVSPDEDVMAACWRLKRAGYTLAIDDFSLDDPRRALADMADIVKIDFRLTAPAAQVHELERLRRRGVALLAEKVETEEEYQVARGLGYTYFQGYFFGRPVIVTGRSIPATKIAGLKLLQSIHRPDADLDELYQIIKDDVALSYKLLRFINSVIFGFRQRINNLRQAVVLLGVSGTRKWASMIIVSDLGHDRPPELVVESVMRARFCEGLAEASELKGRAPDLFLLGLFSLIDSLVGRPMAEVLGELPIDPEIHDALVGGRNPLRDVLDLVVAYEHADWESLGSLSARVHVPEMLLPPLYRTALDYATQATSPAA